MRLKISLIGREFPPAVGGMEAVAWHLANELAKTDDVTVFTRTGVGVPDTPFGQKPVLTGRLGRDARHVRREQSDICFALNAVYASVAGQLPGPVWIYAHGNDFLCPSAGLPRWWDDVLRNAPHFWRYRKRLLRPLWRHDLSRGLPHVAGILCNSQNTASLFNEYYGRRPIVVSPGVDDRFFSDEALMKRQLAADDTLRLLTVSRLTKRNRRKNVDGVLHAVSQLVHNSRIQYTVIGDGDDLPRLKALAGELGIGSQVRFTGRVGDEELLQEYARADLFVLASKADARDVEGFGIVYLEACAAATPALCSREGGATDAVVDGENGILIDRSDPDSIAAGIRRFLEMRSELTPERARRFAENFRWPKVAKRVRDCIVSTVEPKHAPNPRVGDCENRRETAKTGP